MKTEFMQSLKSLLNDCADVQRQFFRSDFNPEETKWDEDEVIEFRNKLETEGISAMYEDNFGGEGQGDQYWSVYSFTKDTEKVYVKFNGWYASYNGAEYEEFFFVEPFEKTVTDYKQI